ncbi:MAG: hypothetical protein KF774_01330 [Planctomyces sp.]|nr:hypothetical protein [Planctomyces sp.]
MLLLLATLATGRDPPLEEFAIVMQALIAGWSFACLIGWVGIAAALSKHIAVYIVPDLKDRCGGDFHNMATLTIRVRGFNRAVLVVASSLSVPFLSVGFALMVKAPAISGPLGEWMTGIGASLLLAGAIGAVVAVAFISGRVAALNPAVAWPEYFTMVDQN